MSWNHLRLIVDPQGFLHPVIGTGGLTRDQAKEAIAVTLEDRGLGLAATLWRAAPSCVEHMSIGPIICAIYRYPDAEDPRVAGRQWCLNWSASLSQASTEVLMATLTAFTQAPRAG